MSPVPTTPGIFVGIGGPSGAGKDTLIRHAQRRLADDPRFVFVQRTITRPPDGATETHLSVDAATFARHEAAGAFALTWSAHGLSYGLPIAVDSAIAEGRIAVANISRAVLPALRARYRHVVPIAVSVPPALLRARLAARGRESAAEIDTRLARAGADSYPGWRVVANAGAAAEAGDRLVTLLREAAERD